jgi:hypothetical protein
MRSLRLFSKKFKLFKLVISSLYAMLALMDPKFISNQKKLCRSLLIGNLMPNIFKCILCKGNV